MRAGPRSPKRSWMPSRSRSFLGADRRRPVLDILGTHVLVRQEPGVLIAPLFDIDEVLFARQQRAAAEGLESRAVQLAFEPAHEIAHDPLGHLRAFAGIGEAEQQDMAEQDAPM